MPDYEEKMLVLLAEKYRSSKKDSGTNRIIRRTKIVPRDLYPGYNSNDGDIEHINAVNHAAAQCREKGFLTFEMNGFSNEIAALYLVDAEIEKIERYLMETYHYESKHDKLGYIEQMIFRYSGRSPVADLECAKLVAGLEKKRVPKNYLQTEDVLKALVFIENNRQPLYIREASMLIYGSSKYLEENSLESICRLLRAYWKRPCEEDELPDEILNEYGIMREKQKICLKGDITITKAGEKIKTGAFRSGIEFYADELDQIDRIDVHTSRFITVENRTSYLRCQAEDTSFFYLGGYANRSQRDFLKLIYKDNPALKYLHFGDIDAGGFYIHDHLCRITMIPFQMQQMSVKQLKDERYRSCIQPLTENDRKRLRALAAQDIYRETAEYMLEHGGKLEQEIISYFGVGSE